MREDGRHVIERKGKQRSFAQLKRMKEQDWNYASMQQQQEQRSIDRIRDNLQGLEDAQPHPHSAVQESKEQGGEDAEDDGDEDDEEDEEASTSTPAKRRHVMFTDAASPSTFSPAAHFHTIPSLLSRTHNRPTLTQLASAPLTVNLPPSSSLLHLDKARQQTYRQLAQRVARKAEVDKEVARLQRQRVLMGKGRRRKLVKRDEFGEEVEGQTQFVWKQERKK